LLKQFIGSPNLKSDDTIAAHDAKLLIDSNKLPAKCSMITRGIRISTPSTSAKVIDLKSNRKIAPIKGTTGAFIDTTHIFYDTEKRTFIELDLKKSCFYMDWDIDNKTWKYDISTDTNQLKENVKYFKETIHNFNCL
jgi:hypothetical protein